MLKSSGIAVVQVSRRDLFRLSQVCSFAKPQQPRDSQQITESYDARNRRGGVALNQEETLET